MIKDFFRKFYQGVVAAVKRIDKVTNYRIGKIIRVATNVNTRKYWDKELGSYGESWRDFSYNHILEFFPKNSHFSLLDIGCALGDGCILWKENFPKGVISGADFSRIAIAKAKKKTDKIQFFVLDISQQDPPRKYDYITIIHTLEHFNNPFPIVDKCLKFVNQALIIQVPYEENFGDPHLYGRGQHRYLFNKHTFSKYKCTILKITEHKDPSGYICIIYKLVP